MKNIECHKNRNGCEGYVGCLYEEILVRFPSGVWKTQAFNQSLVDQKAMEE